MNEWIRPGQHSAPHGFRFGAQLWLVPMPDKADQSCSLPRWSSLEVLTFTDSVVSESVNGLKNTYSSRDQGGSIYKDVIWRFVQYSIKDICFHDKFPTTRAHWNGVRCSFGFPL